jgi:hypothetical protein
VSTIFGIIFLLSFFLRHILFSQKELSFGYEILHRVLSDKKIKFGVLFKCFSSCARETPTRTCAWGFHEHSTIATE